MARYWLGPWVWDTTDPLRPFWKQPLLSVACLDLRSTPNCASRVTPQGFGLFVTPNAANLGSEYTNLGTDLLATLSQAQLNRWQSALALPNTLAAVNLRDVLWETITLQADPVGDDRCMPLVPTSSRRYECRLAGQLIQIKSFRFADPESTPLFDLLKRQYRAIRQATLDGQMRDRLGNVSTDHYRKVLGSWVRKYGINYRAFQPADVPDETPLSPETTFNESFDKADSDTLGPDLTWTEVAGDVDVVSNQFSAIAAWGIARAEHDLSSDDHYAQVDVTKLDNASSNRVGTCARFAAAAQTFYLAVSDTFGTRCVLSKYVDGTETSLGNGVTVPSLPDPIKAECDGSTIKAFYDGVEEVSVTDMTITGNTRGGVYSGDIFATEQQRGDNFVEEDLSGGQTIPVGLASETDASLAVTSRKAITIGLPTEADTIPGSVTPEKHRAVGLASEVDTALSTLSGKAREVGLPTEADISLALTSAKTKLLGQATSIDSALPLGTNQVITVGLCTETDVAIAVAHGKAKLVGLATETDSSQPAQARKLRSVGLVLETDAALPITVFSALGVAVETDSALSLVVLVGQEFRKRLVLANDAQRLIVNSGNTQRLIVDIERG